jgi:MFS family permease
MESRPGFRTLWLAATTSALGDGVRWIALPLLAVRQSTDPGTISLITVAEEAPWLLFGLFAGVLADRYDRRRVVWITDVGRALLMGAFTLAVAGGAAGIPVIAALGFLLTCGEAVSGAAVSGLIPALVPAPRRPAANGRLQAGVLVTDTLVGSPVGALLFTAAAVAPFALDAATFLVAALLIALLPGRYRPVEPAARSALPEIAEGIRFLWRHRLLRLLCGITAVSNMVYTGLVAILVLYIGQVLHLGGTGYGLLVATFAVGGILGGLAAGRLADALGTRLCILGSIAVFTGCAAVLAVTGSAAVAGGAIAVFGFASAVTGAVCASVRQTAVPDRLLGRVTSAYRMVNFGAGPLGAVAAGAAAHAYGLRAPFLAAAVISLLTGLVVLGAWDQAEIGMIVQFPAVQSARKGQLPGHGA